MIAISGAEKRMRRITGGAPNTPSGRRRHHMISPLTLSVVSETAVNRLTS